MVDFFKNNFNPSGAGTIFGTPQNQTNNFYDFMAKEYGSYHNTGFVTQNNPVIDSERFRFKGKSIPARRWLHDSDTFKHDKKIIDSFFKSIGKALKK